MKLSKNIMGFLSLKSWDMFGTPVSFKLGKTGASQFNTNTGGLCSILVHACLAFLIYDRAMKMLSGDLSTINTATQIHDYADIGEVPLHDGGLLFVL
jgi:hypothetical protein